MSFSQKDKPRRNQTKWQGYLERTRRFFTRTPLLSQNGEITDRDIAAVINKGTSAEVSRVLKCNSNLQDRNEQILPEIYRHPQAAFVVLSDKKQIVLAKRFKKALFLEKWKKITKIVSLNGLEAGVAIGCLSALAAGILWLAGKFGSDARTIDPMLVIGAFSLLPLYGIYGTVRETEINIREDLEFELQYRPGAFRSLLAASNICDEAKGELISDLDSETARILLPKVSSERVRSALEKRLVPSAASIDSAKKLLKEVLTYEEQVANAKLICEQGTVTQVGQVLESGNITAEQAVRMLEARKSNQSLPALPRPSGNPTNPEPPG